MADADKKKNDKLTMKRTKKKKKVLRESAPVLTGNYTTQSWYQ